MHALNKHKTLHNLDWLQDCRTVKEELTQTDVRITCQSDTTQSDVSLAQRNLTSELQKDSRLTKDTEWRQYCRNRRTDADWRQDYKTVVAQPKESDTRTAKRTGVAQLNDRYRRGSVYRYTKTFFNGKNKDLNDRKDKDLNVRQNKGLKDRKKWNLNERQNKGLNKWQKE